MYRKAIEELKQWKSRKNRKPLILRGARQVGKTRLIKELFSEIKYINFDNIFYENEAKND